MTTALTDQSPPESGGLLAGTWRILCSGNAQNSQIALAIAVIASIGAIGCVIVFLYGLFARGCGTACGSFADSRLAGGFVAVLAAAGAFSVGGMLGLLFGSPRWGDAPVAQPPPSGNAGDDAAGAPDSVTSQSARPSTAGSGVRPNTSLERIADWLTTMIVGLGLVNLTTIGAKVQAYGRWVTQAITLDPTSPANWIPGVVISAAFAFAGFLLIYLWSLRFLPSEIERAYEREFVERVVRNEVSKKTEKLAAVTQASEEIAKTLDAYKAQPIFRVPAALLDALESTFVEMNIDAATIADVRRRYAEAATWTDDPMTDFGPASSEAGSITGTVSPTRDGNYMVHVDLGLTDTALTDMVWLQHNTFPNFYRVAKLDEGRATFEFLSRGSCWLGVVVARGDGQDALRLGIDLGTLNGADAQFRDE